MTAVDERIGTLREALRYFGNALGFDHVAADPCRQNDIAAAMRWVSDEIGRTNSREYRLNAPVHPDILQGECYLALRQLDAEARQKVTDAARAVEAERDDEPFTSPVMTRLANAAAVSEGTPGEAKP